MFCELNLFYVSFLFPNLSVTTNFNQFTLREKVRIGEVVRGGHQIVYTANKLKF